MAVKRLWPPAYDDDSYTATATVAGVPLRLYGATWCAETGTGWRDAFWLGRLNRHRVLDQFGTARALGGQLEMKL